MPITPRDVIKPTEEHFSEATASREACPARLSLRGFIVAAAIVILHLGCSSRDQFREHRVGNVYEIVGNLCLLDGNLLDERTESVENWQKHAATFQKTFLKLPLGTKIRIASIEKQSLSSWNTGSYSYTTVFVTVQLTGHEGTRYDASSLTHGSEFGQYGTNVTLKLVSRAGGS